MLKDNKNREKKSILLSRNLFLVVTFVGIILLTYSTFYVQAQNNNEDIENVIEEVIEDIEEIIDGNEEIIKQAEETESVQDEEEINQFTLSENVENGIVLLNADFDSGSGTEADPYIIKNQVHLENIANYLSAHFRLEANIAVTGSWTAIGSQSSQFSGTFDGNEYTISNLLIDGSHGSNDQAFFGYVGTAGMIKNLTLANVSIQIADSGTDIACIAGENKGTITNCHVTTNSSIAASNGSNVGGIAGENQITGVIHNCTVSSANIIGNKSVGGLVGKNLGTIINGEFNSNYKIIGTTNTGGIVGTMENGTIENNLVTSNLVIDATSNVGGVVGNLTLGTITNSKIDTNVKINATSHVGGIVGYMASGMVKDSSNQTTGGISAKDSTLASEMGGIVGCMIEGTIENCSNSMDLTITSDLYYFGGIAGSNESGTIKNSNNSGAITIYGACVGGIVGLNKGTVEDCTNTGTIKSNGKNMTGAADDSVNIGGIVGWNTKDSNSSIVDNCSNQGKITGEGQYANIGGIVGLNDNSCIVQESENTGTITSMNGTSDLNAGGIVGQNAGLVQECVNTSAGAVSSHGNNIGGIVGLNASGLVDHCYHNSSGALSGKYNVGGIVGKNHDTGKVINSYNVGSGTIKGTADNVGGIVGSNDGMVSVGNCYNTNPNLSSNTTNVGGIAGCNVSGATIYNCYSKGTISNLSSSAKKASVVGSNDSTVSYVYWDNTNDTIGINGGTVTDAISFSEPLDVVNDKSLTEVLNEHLQSSYLTWKVDTDDYAILGEGATAIRDLSTGMISGIHTDYTYQGSSIEPSIIVSLDGDILIKGTDYKVTYEDNVNVGMATIKVEGIGNFNGENSTTFNIIPKEIVVTPDSDQYHVVGEAEEKLTYIVEGVVSTEVAKFTGQLEREVGESVGEYLITEGTLALTDGDGFLAKNYTLTIKDDVIYEIVAGEEIDLTQATLSEVLDGVYSGKNHEPKVLVKLDDKILIEDTHYYIVYESNLNVGETKLIVKGIEASGAAVSYVGEVSTTFNIIPKEIVVTPDSGLWHQYGQVEEELSYTYIGVVEGESPYFSGALERETGELIGSYLISRGTLELIDGEGFIANNYSLAVVEGVGYEIITASAIDISEASFYLSGSYQYEGSKHTPKVVVTMDGDVLSENVHYTLAYENNLNAGIGIVTIEGTKNYTDEVAYIGQANRGFVIQSRSLTVIPESNLFHEEGESAQTLAYTSQGAVNNEVPVFVGELSRISGETIGIYEISQGTLALTDGGNFKASNYVLGIQEGVTYEIVEAPIVEEEVEEEAEEEAEEDSVLEENVQVEESKVELGEELKLESEPLVEEVVHIENNEQEETFSIDTPIEVGVMAMGVVGIGSALATLGTNTTLAPLANKVVNFYQQVKAMFSGSEHSNIKLKKVKIKRRKVFSEKILHKNAGRFRYAVGQFNLATIEEVKELLVEMKHIKTPVVVSVTHLLDGSEEQYHTALDDIIATMKENKIKIPVCIHLEEGTFEQCEEAISLGYSSVMYQVPEVLEEEQFNQLEALAKLCKKKSTVLELRQNILNEKGEVVKRSPEEYKKLAKLGVSSLSLRISKEEKGYPDNWAQITRQTIEEIRQTTKKFNFVVHHDSSFLQEEWKALFKTKVVKVNIPLEDNVLADKERLERKVKTFKSIGKANNRLKIANYGFKIVKMIIKFI